MAVALFPLNEARWDRAARIVLGLVLLALVFVGPKTYWGLLGLIPLATGAIGRCPVYRLFGVSTLGRGARSPGTTRPVL